MLLAGIVPKDTPLAMTVVRTTRHGKRDIKHSRSTSGRTNTASAYLKPLLGQESAALI
jgi:hypothetical protein